MFTGIGTGNSKITGEKLMENNIAQITGEKLNEKQSLPEPKNITIIDRVRRIDAKINEADYFIDILLHHITGEDKIGRIDKDKNSSLSCTLIECDKRLDFLVNRIKVLSELIGNDGE